MSADLADIQLISKHYIEILILLCVIDAFSIYTWVVSLKDTTDMTSTNVLQLLIYLKIFKISLLVN